MIWLGSKKGSGHQYNSMSGHSSLFRSRTRKIIGLVIKSKMCCYCNASKKKSPNLPVPLHHCWKNHDGSSGSMESAGCVELVIEAFDKRHVIINKLCCDDDSSIRADFRWSNIDFLANNNTDVLPMMVPKKVGVNRGKMQPRPDKGKLPSHVLELVFVADPNHRRKGLLTGELIGVSKLKAKLKMTMTRGWTLQGLERTLHIWQGPSKTDQQQSSLMLLKQHWNTTLTIINTVDLGAETPAERQRIIKYYRSKEVDAELYNLLHSTIDRFVSLDKLLEMVHGLDTNVNECYNNICTWFAPKNKVFAGSGSLQNRITFAVSISSLGYNDFFLRLFDKLGIGVTDNVAYYLRLHENTRSKRLVKIRTKDAKLQKNKAKYDRLNKDTRITKMEMLKRQGKYRRGMNLLDNPYDEREDHDENDDGGGEPSAKRQSMKYCENCGKKGHTTIMSKKCTEYGKNNPTKNYRQQDDSIILPLLLPQEAPTPGVAAARTANDDDDDNDFLVFSEDTTVEDNAVACSRDDAIPFDDTQYEDDSDMELFVDAETWDSDDDSKTASPHGSKGPTRRAII
jgi:hypothetical protein